MSHANIATHCKGCVFAICGRDGFQHQCSLDRPKKLGVAPPLEDSKYFVLERFCNAYRPHEWSEQLSFAESLNAEETVLNELYPRLGTMIKLNTDRDNEISNLDITLQSLQKIEKGLAWIVVITNKVEYNEEVWQLMSKYFADTGIKFHILQVLEESDQEKFLLDQSFSHAQNGWVLYEHAGIVVDPNIIDKIHNIINVEMKQMLLVEPRQGLQGLLFQAHLFKFVGGNGEKIFQDESVIEGDFLDKIREAQTRSTAKAVFTWEEFNAS